MKKTLFILTIMFMGLFVSAQYTYEFTTDTIVTSSSVDTIYFTPTKQFTNAGIIGMYVQADSVTGATGGTIAYQSKSYSGTTWHTLATDTFNHAGVTYYNNEGTAYGNKYRIMVTAPSSTQNTLITATIEYKPTFR